MVIQNKICIVDTVYALAFYLLVTNEADIEKTFFFVGDGIPTNIRQNLLRCIYIPTYSKKSRIHFATHALWIKFRYGIRISKNCDFWGQDHIWYFPILLGNRHYNLIEDCPMIFQLHEKSGNYNKVKQFIEIQKKSSSLKKWLHKKIFGNISGLTLGHNRQCEKYILSKKIVLPYVNLDKVYSYEWSNLWKQSYKKRLACKKLQNLHRLSNSIRIR